MRTVQITIYKASELTERARDKAYEKWLKGFYYPWYAEIGQCRKGMLGVFPGARLDRDNDVTTHGIDDTLLEMKGKRLCAWLQSNVVDELKQGKYRSMKTYDETYHKRVRRKEAANGNKWREYRSAVFTSVECPFSGMTVDCSALEPIMDFVTGKGYPRAGLKWQETTLGDIIGECFHAINKYQEDDIEYLTSMEAFLEDADANEWEFQADGSMA